MAYIMNRITRTSMENPTILLLFSSIFSVLFAVNIAVDTITTSQFLEDGKTLISSGGNFELGFFSPSASSHNTYVGIWYKKISVRTVVWVANREIPLTNTSGVLRVIQPGVLALLKDTNNTIWSSNASRSSSSSKPIAQLLDSGNLVVRDADDQNPENFFWQSFDYPSDTLLPGMKLGKNVITGLDRHLTSWSSDDDPTPGYFTFWCDPQGYPQLITRNGSGEQYRSGPWNGLRFSGTPNLRENKIYKFGFVYNEKEVYYFYQLWNSSIVTRLGLTSDGRSLRWIWIDRTQNWATYLSVQTDNCDVYRLCGAHGNCDVDNSPPCRCLDKFEPKYQNEWDKADWSNGCIRSKPLDCQTDGFLKYTNIKLPDTRYSWFNRTMSLKECESVCKKNCSCMAYTNLDIRNEGSGCLLWFGDLLDIREYPENGQDLYIRMESSELDYQSSSDRKKGDAVKIIFPVLAGIIVLLGLCLMFYVRKRKLQQKKEGKQKRVIQQDYTNESQKEDLELPIFDLSSISKATNDFSIDNKLGEGGFGPVYKGVLEEGREIAVKRLSKTSRQGRDEFKNEVICIAKLQHRNLVKLLGCCIQGEEKMLIYEYMPNKSLDCFIFDGTQRTLLDWPCRFSIINGIARGLLYLHQDSRLRIIHRDLKASNILLDVNMNPKISDFGLARSFAENETGLNTNRVVGTYGYMSPEYAVEGIFSVKSDVFSFGVLVLEIVSGKRNRGFIHRDHSHNLLGHAWRLYTDDRCMELVDAYLRNSCRPYEVLRSIHVGLLCVQQYPDDRPSMSSVVMMLGSEGALPPPKQPGFFTERNILKGEYSSSTNAPSSIDEITTTLVDGR